MIEKIIYELCGSCVCLLLRVISVPFGACSPNPCKNGGTCRDISESPNRDEYYKCECTPGFSGRFCDIKGAHLLILH